MRSLASRWPADLLLPVLVAAVEAATIAPLVGLLAVGALSIAPSDVPWPVAWGALGLTAFWSARLMTGMGVPLRRARLVALVLWIGTTLLWLRFQYGFAAVSAGRGPLVLTGLLALVAWWRGLEYGSDPAPFLPDRLRRLVRWAWIALTCSLLAGALVGGAGGDEALARGRSAVPVAVAGGLLAVAAAQIEQARATARRRGGRAPERGRWLAFAGAVAILVVGCAALVGAVLGHDVLRVLYVPVVTALRWFSLGLFYLVLAVALVLFLAVWPLIWLARQVIGHGGGPSNPLNGTSPQDFKEFADRTEHHFSPEVALALRGGLVVIALAVAILVLFSTLRRYRATRHDDTGEEEHESLWSRDLARGQLRRLLPRRRPARTAVAHIDLTRDPATVREAYQYLLELAARSDRGRHPAESASAFSRRIEAAWPDVAVPVADLTERYLRVRYGEQPEEPERAPAKADWRAIRRVIPGENGTR